MDAWIFGTSQAHEACNPKLLQYGSKSVASLNYLKTIRHIYSTTPDTYSLPSRRRVAHSENMFVKYLRRFVIATRGRFLYQAINITLLYLFNQITATSRHAASRIVVRVREPLGRFGVGRFARGCRRTCHRHHITVTCYEELATEPELRNCDSES